MNINNILYFIFYLCLSSIIIGPAVSYSFGTTGVSIYISDILLGLLLIISLFTKGRALLEIIKKDAISRYFLLFVTIALISLIFSPLSLKPLERLVSFLYLARVIIYFFIYPVGRILLKSNIITQKAIIKYLTFVGIILAFLGWVQYFLYPDLRNLSYLGWDPHYKRIFATYFDPNYFGLLMVFVFLILINQYQKFRAIFFMGSIFIFITLMFTYSRSSYLAFIAGAAIFAYLKKQLHLFFIMLIGLIAIAFILPRGGGEGVKLERLFSIEARLGNWQEALTLFSKQPILGAGFNTIRYARREHFNQDDGLELSHSGAGFENSYLFVAATCGIIGLITYLIYLMKCFKHGNLLTKTTFAAVAVHSFFLNSLLYPSVMLWLWIILSLNKKE